MPLLLDRLDRVDLLVKAVQSAQLRSQLMALKAAAQPAAPATAALRGVAAGYHEGASGNVASLPGDARYHHFVTRFDGAGVHRAAVQADAGLAVDGEMELPEAGRERD